MGRLPRLTPVRLSPQVPDHMTVSPRDASTPPNLPPPRLARRSHRLRLLRCPAPSLHQGRRLPQIECFRIAWLVSHLASTYRPTQAAAPSSSRRSRPLLVGLGSGFHRQFRRIYAVYSIGGHSYVFFPLCYGLPHVTV